MTSMDVKKKQTNQTHTRNRWGSGHGLAGSHHRLRHTSDSRLLQPHALLSGHGAGLLEVGANPSLAFISFAFFSFPCPDGANKLRDGMDGEVGR